MGKTHEEVIMFTKIKELCRMIGGTAGTKTETETKKVVNHMVFVREDAKIDVEKLKSIGFHVIMGHNVKEGEDYQFIDKVQITTTTTTHTEDEGEE
jgi:hypothetical protein